MAGLASPAPPVDDGPGRIVARHVEVLVGLGRYDDAAELAGARLRGAPDDHDLRVILGHALREAGSTAAAAEAFRTVLAAESDHVAAAAGLAMCLFALGDWQSGYAAFDIRFRLMETPPRVTRRDRSGRTVELPRWRGGSVPDGLLVLAEQGLGDTLQFARYLPALARTGARITAVVQPRLIELLRPLAPDIEWRSSEVAGSVEGVGGWLAMMDIPFVLGLAPDRLVTAAAPLRADGALAARMADRIGGDGLRIGVVWQGNPDPRIDAHRSMDASALAALVDLPGVRLVSLQHGAAGAALRRQPFAARVLDLGPELDQGADGFVETAAAIAALDLVVTVDTAAAHLAAALGKPVFLCLKAPGADWRWLSGRDDTVWYATVRLFRQKTPGDWSHLMAEVAAAITALRGAAPLPAIVGEAVPGPKLIPAVLGVGSFFARLTEVSARLAVAADPAEAARLTIERRGLQGAWARLGLDPAPLKPLISALSDLAGRAVVAERRLEMLERAGDHGPEFVATARAMLLLGRERTGLIDRIDRLGTRKHLAEAPEDAVA